VKKLIGDPQSVVADMVDGLVRADDRLARIAGHAVIVDARAATRRDDRVALISGGGSGHEPAHAGYVGDGMLSAAVLGEVFTSPSVDAVLAAIRAVTGAAGCLLIVKNYTGDRLNFGLAAALARSEGLGVDMVLVDDDAAVAGSGRVGRRGLAGTILIHKLAGAAARDGKPLAEVKAIAERAIQRLRTMGVGLNACTVPSAGKPNFTLGDGEIEFGLGIHGEQGIERAPLAPVEAIVDRLVATIVDQQQTSASDELVLLVNGLGGTPTMELLLVARAALATLAARGLSVVRVATGNFLTALEMPGCSLSLLPVDAAQLTLLDSPVDAPAWTGLTRPNAGRQIDAADVASEMLSGGPLLSPADARRVRAGFEAVIARLTAAEPALTELDREVGDGDLGISLARGVGAVSAVIEALPFDRPADLFGHLAAILRRHVGGTSGPLYAAFALGVSTSLRECPDRPTLADWADACASGCASISRIGGAGPGDRTMLDALLPAVDALRAGAKGGRSAGDALIDATRAAERGVETTRHIVAALGRSSYLGDRVVGHPDPGASAVALWLSALADAVGSDVG